MHLIVSTQHSQLLLLLTAMVIGVMSWNKAPSILCRHITKTYLYNFDPLKPHFYIVKLGFSGIYIIFLISAQKHRLWVLVRTPRRGGSNEYPQSMFWAEIWKISAFFIWKFSVFGGEIFYILNRHVFVMPSILCRQRKSGSTCALLIHDLPPYSCKNIWGYPGNARTTKGDEEQIQAKQTLHIKPQTHKTELQQRNNLGTLSSKTTGVGGLKPDQSFCPPSI